MPIDRSIPKFACEYCDEEFSSFDAALACEQSGPPPQPLPVGTPVMLAPTMGRGGAPKVVTIGRVLEHEVRRGGGWGDKPSRHYIAYYIDGQGHNQSFTSDNIVPHRPGIINVDGAISSNVIHADRLETVLRDSPERADELAEVLNKFGCQTGPKQVWLAADQFYHHTWSGHRDKTLIGPMDEDRRRALLTFSPIAGDEPYSLRDRERPSRTLDQLSDNRFYGAAIAMLFDRFDGNFVKARAYLLTHGAKQIAKELLEVGEAWARGEEGVRIPYQLLVPVGDRTYGAKLQGEQRKAVKALAGERKGEVTRIKTVSDASRFVHELLDLESPAMNRSDKPFPNAYVLAVASGKGGSGKTSITAAAGFAAAEAGIKTLLIDVDVHGPSLGHLLDLPQGIKAQEEGDTFGKIVPHEVAPNLHAFSMQQLISEDTPVTWRGAAVEGFLQFLVSTLDTDGAELIIIDLPPGTGEVERAVMNHMQPDGTLLVTTGSHLSHADCRRMANYMMGRVDMVGVVENMSRRDVVVDGKVIEGRLFGEEGDTERFAASLGEGVAYLGSTPFNPDPAALAADEVMKGAVQVIEQRIKAVEAAADVPEAETAAG
jgi:Mrp family chromosome partitioning ATPase